MKMNHRQNIKSSRNIDIAEISNIGNMNNMKETV